MSELTDLCDRIRTVADEAFGPFPHQTATEAINKIEAGIFEQRRAIAVALAALERLRDCDWVVSLPDRADFQRVVEWAKSKNRKPANLAFTAGPERQAAYWIEWAEINMPNPSVHPSGGASPAVSGATRCCGSYSEAEKKKIKKGWWHHKGLWYFIGKIRDGISPLGKIKMKKTSKIAEKYTVTNVYGISGESNHRTPEAALKAASKREGDGWIVVDQDGNQWGNNGPEAVIVARAESR